MYCAKPDDQKYKNHFKAGVYVCSSCSTELFHAKAKYKHASAWPAFSEPVAENVIRKEVETEKQTSSDKPALKLFCMKCDNILGHEFIGDGPDSQSRF